MDEGTITSNIIWSQFSGPSLITDSEKSSKESVVLTTCIPVHMHFHSTKLLASYQDLGPRDMREAMWTMTQLFVAFDEAYFFALLSP